MSDLITWLTFRVSNNLDNGTIISDRKLENIQFILWAKYSQRVYSAGLIHRAIVGKHSVFIMNEVFTMTKRIRDDDREFESTLVSTCRAIFATHKTSSSYYERNIHQKQKKKSDG